MMTRPRTCILKDGGNWNELISTYSYQHDNLELAIILDFKLIHIRFSEGPIQQ